MAHNYAPIVLDTRMGDYGYWIVTISVAPGSRMSIMVAKVGVTQQEAQDLVLEASALYPAPKGHGLWPILQACPNAVTGARSDAATLTIT
jgi:hypothetical protein